MMAFMKTFSFLILTVILAIFGSYLLNSQNSPMKELLADKHNKLQVSSTTPKHQVSVPKESLASNLKQSQIDKLKVNKDTQAPAPKVKKPKTPALLVTNDKPTQPSTPAKEPAPTNEVSTPKSKLQPPQDQVDQTINPLLIDMPPDTLDNKQLPPPDSTQQKLDDLRDWMVTNLGATDFQLPTKLMPADNFVVNPDTWSIIVDDSAIITFDKTITGNDFSIRYVVTNGVLSIVAEGNVPKELFPPGFSK